MDTDGHMEPVFDIRIDSADPACWVAVWTWFFRKQSCGPKYHPWYLEALQTPAGPAFLAIPFAPVHQSQALRHTRPRPEITTFCFSEYCVIKYLIVYHLDDFSVMF